MMQLIACVTVAGAACAATQMPDIADGWKFSRGDDPAWADPSFDDSSWAAESDADWKMDDGEDYLGFGWYRARFSLPETLKTDADFAHYETLKLELGRIDDVDTTYLNGEEIGGLGTLPPEYEGAWQAWRKHWIPAGVLRWGEENVVAVRVYNHNGGGGMLDDRRLLSVPGWRDHTKLRVGVGRGDGIFVEEDALPISVTLSNGYYEELAGTLTWKIEDDEWSVLAEEEQQTSVAQGAETTLAPEHSPTEPGFYRVNCEFALDGEGDPLELSTILGYRPEELASPSTREADFDDFWRDTLGELATVKPRFRMKRTPERDTATHEVYEVKMRSLGDVRLGGWYEMPREGERFAAVMRVPGYSGAMMPSGRPELVAILSFNPRAHGNSQKDVPHDPQDYWVRGLDDKQGYFYQGAYADCVRGVDFLASRPEVDASRIAVTGGSQGGGLTLATAALDPRISACAPDIAFLCNWEKYFRATKWPEIDGWIAAEGHRSWAKMLRTLSYVDAMNMAGRITCPAFFSMGLQDPTCPPATIFGVYNRLDVAKEYRVYADAGHWVPDEHSAAKWKWMLEQLGVELVDEPN